MWAYTCILNVFPSVVFVGTSYGGREAIGIDITEQIPVAKSFKKTKP